MSVYNSRSQIITAYSVNELLLLTVSAVKELENLFHRSLVIALCVKLTILIKIFSNLRPSDSCAISLSNLLLAAEPYVSLDYVRND